MITIWGRETGLCVKKVLWCCEELDVEFERFDAGKQYGQTDTPEYLKMNPNGTVPTLIDGDYVLWESDAVMRYLALQYGTTSIYPTSPREHGDVNRWIDWTSGGVWNNTVTLIATVMRTPKAARKAELIDPAAEKLGKLWGIADDRLKNNDFICGKNFTIADVTMGVLAQLWMAFELDDRPRMTGFEAWYDRLTKRSGFQKYATLPLEPN